MTLQKTILPCRTDNYAYILHDENSRNAVCIDAPDAGSILTFLESKQLQLTHLLITHHHADHVDGIAALKQAHGCKVIAPAKEFEKISGADEGLSDGTSLSFENQPIQILDTPGHTSGHVSYYFPEMKSVFTGDTLFVMGCGRLLECDAATMWQSLNKLRALPEDTFIFCGHEYAKSNAAFAQNVYPENLSVKARAGVIDALRRLGKPVIPSTIGEELATNPFLLARDLETFRELRLKKDSF